MLQVCPAPDRRRKLLGPAGCDVPVNVSNTGLSLDTTLATGLYSHTDNALEVLDLPTTPGKQQAINAFRRFKHAMKSLPTSQGLQQQPRDTDSH